MTTTYYKAVTPEGFDFATGLIDYGSAVGTNKPVKHPHPVRDSEDASYYLSVSVEPGDCTGFMWDRNKGARIFEVNPVGKPWTPHPDSMPNKRAVAGVRVLRELEPHMLFGPQGEALVAMINIFYAMSSDDRCALYNARPIEWHNSWEVVHDGRANRAGLSAARYALSGRLHDGWSDVGGAAYGAALAVLLRHTIGQPDGLPQHDYDTLTAPWVKVTGKKAHPADVVF